MSTRPEEQERRSQASHLHSAIEGAAAHLRSHRYFTGIPVITQDDGDIDTMIAKKLGSLGIVCTVMFSDGNCESPNVPGPSIDGVSIIVEVAENTTTNKTGKTCLEVAERVLRRLHLYVNADTGAIYTCAKKAVYPATPPRPANVCYQCAFNDGETLILTPLTDDVAD